MSEDDFTGEQLRGPSDSGPDRKPTPTGVRRVPPNPDAPKLRPKTAERIAVADQKSAEAYDELDAAKDKIRALTNEIEAGTVKVALDVSDTAVHRLKNI